MCITYKEDEKDYYSNLDIKKVIDNKTFWKTVKPFLSDKIVSTEGITLIDNGEVVATEQDIANVLNTFFSNIVTNLKIPEYADYDPIANNISDSILKVIVRYRNHPSILTIEEVCKKSHKFSFSFSQVGKKDILEGMQRLDIKKAAQESDILSRIIKENSDIFGQYLLSSFNDAIDKSYFPTALKQANITPVFKTGERYSKDNYRPTAKCVKNV